MPYFKEILELLKMISKNVSDDPTSSLNLFKSPAVKLLEVEEPKV